MRSPTRSAPRFLPPVTGSAQVNVAPAERVLSALSGALLAGYGFSRGSLGGTLLGSLGAALVFRGASGYCPAFGLLDYSSATPAADTPKALEIAQAITVNKPPETVYAFWRKLENLPRFMTHLASVVELGDGRSLWRAESPGPLPDVEWEAKIVDDVPGERIAWRSVEDADVDNAGHVTFAHAPHGGTEVHVRIAYRPPAGDLGHVLGKALDPAFERLVKEDIRRFKHVLEAGEVPTIEGQPRGS